ncbi:hypothetical protein [Pseudoalteromonas byunsanensis]|uniref:Uncharacterized protein n=1 Tax=Pseudoalteromonas byunsanensis TaxID=327939 RepID=A0A1S1NAP2_9GAMM|nr:hypothetical protein [Pseudoalteromonas byunsanensis]OHU96465.1 hypothetical protein BIW53_03815 [Pseudoalteromonas byunsanensis]
MSKVTTSKLIIFLYLSLIVFCIFLLVRVNVLSAQLGELKNAMPSHFTELPAIDDTPSHVDRHELQEVLVRLEQLEESADKLAVQPTEQVSTRHNAQINEPSGSTPEGQMPEQDFHEGRVQWQQKYAASMFEDADKKAQVMAEYLAENYKLDKRKQRQVLSIMREHFVEFAYLISDTDTYPSFNSFSKQVEYLNSQKMGKLSQVLSEQEIKSFNSVDWMTIFKSSGLN